MNSQEKQVVRNAMDEMINSFTRADAEKDLQKDIINKVKEETTVQPKIFRKLAATAYRATFAEQRNTFEEFEALYEEIIAGE